MFTHSLRVEGCMCCVYIGDYLKETSPHDFSYLFLPLYLFKRLCGRECMRFKGEFNVKVN